jgi:hypothetical protein
MMTWDIGQKYMNYLIMYPWREVRSQTSSSISKTKLVITPHFLQIQCPSHCISGLFHFTINDDRMFYRFSLICWRKRLSLCLSECVHVLKLVLLWYMFYRFSLICWRKRLSLCLSECVHALKLVLLWYMFYRFSLICWRKRLSLCLSECVHALKLVLLWYTFYRFSLIFWRIQSCCNKCVAIIIWWCAMQKYSTIPFDNLSVFMFCWIFSNYSKTKTCILLFSSKIFIFI